MSRRLLLAACAVGLAGPAAATPDASGHHGEVVRVEHRDPSALPTRGPSTAPVTIELFFTPGQTSRTAPYRNVERLQAQHPSQIRLVYRILAANGQARLPYAALEAYAEGKFFEFMDRLDCITGPLPCRFMRSSLSNQELLEMGAEIGLDPDRMLAAMTNPPAGYVKALAANDHRKKHHVRVSTLPVALFNGRLPQTQLPALGAPELEREYHTAKDRADELLDRGADPRALADAFDEQNPPSPQDIVIQPGDPDEEFDQVPADPPLATPPLDLAGLPAYGSADAQVTIVVMCTPSSTKCRAAKDTAVNVQRDYPDTVRVVWAPLFGIADAEAADHGLLGDAALCAERVGTTSADDKDFDDLASPGWRWVEAVLGEVAARHRRVPAEQVIDKTAAKLHVDPRAFAACRARMAGTAMTWSERARHAGVRTTPATSVGGRIYPAIQDQNTLQELVEIELAPGWLGEHAPSWRRRL